MYWTWRSISCLISIALREHNLRPRLRHVTPFSSDLPPFWPVFVRHLPKDLPPLPLNLRDFGSHSIMRDLVQELTHDLRSAAPLPPLRAQALHTSVVFSDYHFLVSGRSGTLNILRNSEWMRNPDSTPTFLRRASL